MSQSHIIRHAERADLPSLLQLEESGFAFDRFSKEQYRRLIANSNASVLVLDMHKEIVGSAIMLWRAKSSIGRLYSIVIDPKLQSLGFGRKLLQACEYEAVKNKCESIALEVRADNRQAITAYQKFGYTAFGTITGYYSDGMNALRMKKNLPREDSGMRLDIPYVSQSLEFTCGSACLMMAMKALDTSLVVDRTLELTLWKEATLIYMMSGVGGCDPFGLAIAARKRGYEAHVIIAGKKTPFLSTVRSTEKKDVIRLLHSAMKTEALALGATAEQRNFKFDEISDRMNAGWIPILLVSTYRLHNVRLPHWVVVTGFDENSFYFHDSYETFYREDRSKARDVQMPIEAFRRMPYFGKELNKMVVFVHASQNYKRQ